MMSEKTTLNIRHVIAEIVKDSNYSCSLFSDDQLQSFGEDVFINESSQIALFTESETEYEAQEAGKRRYWVYCPIRDKRFSLKPEELIRQLYLRELLNKDGYGYPKNRIRVEHAISMGRAKKRADIVVLNEKDASVVDIIIEVKKPNLKEGKDQLRSYCNATGAPMGVWTNGEQISYYHRKPPNYFEDIPNIPNADQKLEDVLKERFTLKELILKDKLTQERKTLKEVILELENEVLANAGVDVFEEVFKLIVTKLYDEYESRTDKAYIERRQGENVDIADIPNDTFRQMRFRNTGQSEPELKEKMQDLFEKAKNLWQGIFSDDAKFELIDSHLAISVSSLQDINLFNSNLIILDEAFEYLVNKSARGAKGQYFTPRHVIDMSVLMLNPKRGESMIDTAAGSCGFPAHTIFKLTGNLFTNTEIPDAYTADIQKVFGIDFDEKTVRVARTLNLIAGDGKSNVLELNTLDYERWHERTESGTWLNTYNEGFRRLERLQVSPGDNREFSFDLLMANPPFAGAIKESRILQLYNIATNANGGVQNQVGREILFIERNLDFLKPGGRMAIVLPQGKLGAPTYQRIREYITKHARILAVINLDEYTFKPHTDTKTGVLFLQKWNNDKNTPNYCPEVADYPIFFATSQKSGKDSSGNYQHVKGADGMNVLDDNGHVIIDHDLHSHNGYLDKGIAESFTEWAKKVNLSFADPDAESWEPLPNTYEKSYLAVKSAERIDAYHFHPKHEEIETLMQSHANGYTRVKDEFNTANESPHIAPEKFYRYVEIGSVDIHTGNIIPQEMLGESLPSGGKRILRKGDLIVSKVRTYRGAITIVQEDGLIGSSAFCILRENGQINKETLLSILRSEYFLAWSLKGAVWTSYPTLNEKYILDFPIPLLPKEEQETIKQRVTESFNLLKAAAKQLSYSEGMISESLGLKK